MHSSAALLLAVLFILSICAGFAKRPNIIFLITDDQDVTTHTMNYMPYVKQYISNEGMTFHNAFATSPLCAPSRASILRGQYTHNHPLRSHYENFQETFPKVHNETAAVWLQRAGYTTALFGKYFNGYGMLPAADGKKYANKDLSVPPGWDEWFATYQGFYVNSVVSENGKLVKTQGYQTDVLANRSVEFLRDHFQEDDANPVFLYVGIKAPHAPFIPADRHKHLFPELEVPQYINFNPNDTIQHSKPPPFDTMEIMTAEYLDYNNRFHRMRIQTLQAVDELVRDVVLTLEELGQLENSYIFYTSDHGYQLGQHRIWNTKLVNYDDSLRIPLIVRGPGISKKTHSKAIALTIDFASTWAEMAGGIKVPDFVDGVSLLPIMEQRSGAFENSREFFVAENYVPPVGFLGVLKETQGLRIISRDDKYNMLYNVLHVHSKKHAECYDMNVDPFQVDNQCKHFKKDQIFEATPLWDEIVNCHGESCRKLKNFNSICFSSPYGPSVNPQYFCDPYSATQPALPSSFVQTPVQIPVNENVNAPIEPRGGKENNWRGWLE